MMDHTHSTHEHSTHHESSNHMNHHEMMIQDFKKRFFVSLFLTLPVLIISPVIQTWLGYQFAFTGSLYMLFLLASTLFFYGGWPFIKGFYTEVKSKRPGMMTLIALAISVAYLYSSAVIFGLDGKLFYWELATLIDVMLLGHWIEMRSILSTSDALKKLSELMPDIAHLVSDGELVDIDINNLKADDIVLIKPGEKIPADGLIIKGTSYIDESMLTGESIPVQRSFNDKLIGGSINGDGSIELKIRTVGKGSYLSKVITLVEEAQNSKSTTQLLADRAALWLTAISITVGVSTLIIWISLGQTLAFSLERMATVMVITCPHALGLAIPLVVAVSTSISAKNGLLIKDRTAFENSRKISTIVFDKTGTLTEGKFKVSSVNILDSAYSESEIVKLAATLEKNSEHPIAKGIIDKAKELNIEIPNVQDFKAIKGKGVTGIVEDKLIEVVSPGYLREKNIEILKSAEQKRVTEVFVLRNSLLIGSICLSDRIRNESFEAINKLKSMGLKCWMLTGDNENTAMEVSKELDLDGYFAEVLPHEKLEKIRELQAKDEFVAMTGDGVNDAPALAQADIGIAVGSGSDIAAETADIILVESNPKDIASLILFGRATYKKMIQNLIWATAYNLFAIPLAAGVLYNYGLLISPAVGAIFMSLSTVIVAVNAKLLRVD